MTTELNWDIKYGELIKDTTFVNNCENLKQNLIEVQEVLDQLLPLKDKYEELSLPARIELDLFLAFTINSLHWVRLRINGIDPSKHPIKKQLMRVKAAMLRWQEVKDREKRPTVNKEAAKRFIRSGLYDLQAPPAKRPNKHTKFDENAE